LPLPRSTSKELVLEARERELAVIVGPEWMIVEIVDRGFERLGRIRLDSEAPLVRVVLAYDERSGDVSPVARKQPEGVVGSQAGLVGKRLQGVPLGEEALAKRYERW
jgi:hypothetical protein